MQTKEEMDSILKALARLQARQAWVGDEPPFSMDIIDMLHSTNFRVSPRFHHSYDVVWLYEYLMKPPSRGTPANDAWKTVLDECIRLLAEKGKLVLRLRECSNLRLQDIQTFLSDNPCIDCTMVSGHEYTLEGKKTTVAVFAVTRNNINAYSSNRWTVAVHATDRNGSTIQSLKDAVARQCGNTAEVIEYGPDDSCQEAAARAGTPNLLLLESTVSLPDNFFAGFSSYGYDFDYLTVKQRTEEGEEYPSYCMDVKDKNAPRTVLMDDYNVFNKAIRPSDGILACKTHIAKAGLLDGRHIPLRINYFSTAIRHSLPQGWNKSILTAAEYQMRSGQTGLRSKLARHIPVQLKQTQLYQKTKKILSIIKEH